MAKKPGNGRCVHCLKEGVERNWDHVFPQSSFPDTTAADMEKWQIPSCVACNDRYGRLERDLIGRLGLALDASNPASAGLAEKALRAINPDAAKSEGDAAARDARAKKILREIYKGEELKGKNVMPGLGERWDRPLEKQLGISIPEESLPAMNDKIVRGITFREDDAFIEPDQKIDFFLVKDEDVKDVKEMLDRAGKEFKREPGLVVRRARSADGDCTKSHSGTNSRRTRPSPSRSHRLLCLRASAVHSSGHGLTRGYNSAQESKAGQKPGRGGARENVSGES